MNIGPITESLDNGLVVLTAEHDGERAGCLVGFHTQCSIDPARYAVWVSKLNHTYRVAALADHLALHFLGDSDHDLAELFGGSTGDAHDKFADVDWIEGEHGVPLLTRRQSLIIGRKVSCLDDGGDHVCIVCEPIAIESKVFQPLRLRDVIAIEPGHPNTE